MSEKEIILINFILNTLGICFKILLESIDKQKPSVLNLQYVSPSAE